MMFQSPRREPHTPGISPENRGFPAVRRTADAQPQPVESIVMSCALWHA